MGTKLLKKKIIAKKIDKTFGRHEHILTYIHGAYRMSDIVPYQQTAKGGRPVGFPPLAIG